MNENLEEDKKTQEIIKRAEKSFLEADKVEPFLSREYADETKRIYRFQGLNLNRIVDFDLFDFSSLSFT